VVVNGVLPPLFSREERAELMGPKAADAKAGAGAPGDAAVISGRERATRERVQAESLARLAKELPLASSFLPLIFDDAASPAAIRELARRM
jgi:hypothetical protein